MTRRSRIACIQMQPAIGKVEANVAHSIGLIDRAARARCRRSSCCRSCPIPATCSPRARKPSRLPSRFPADRPVEGLERARRRARLHLVAGICERDGAKLFNSAVADRARTAISARSARCISGTRRTCYFEPGDLGFPGVPHAIGRIGVAICYDGWFPETFRLCGAAGRRHRLRADQLGADSRPGRRPRGDGEHPRDGGRAFATRSSSPVPIASAPSAVSPSRARA